MKIKPLILVLLLSTVFGPVKAAELSQKCRNSIRQESRQVPSHSRRFTERTLTEVLEGEFSNGAARIYIRSAILNRASIFRVRLSNDQVNQIVNRSMASVNRLQRICND